MKQTAYDILGAKYYTERKAKKRMANEFVEMPATLSLLDKVKGKKILDIGCGPGLYAKILSKRGAKVQGIDPSKKFIAIAKKEAPKASFSQGTAEKLPFKKNSFDIALAALVLDHVADLDKAFQEVYRILKPRGFFVFSIANPIMTTRELVKIGKKQYHLLGYSRDRKRVFGDYFRERKRYDQWQGVKVYDYHRTY